MPGEAAPGSCSRQAGVYAAITLVWALAAMQWPVNDLVVPWDSKNQFYAFFRFVAMTIHEGATPFWNPYHYGGHPSIADPQSFIFSPLFMLWAFLDPSPSLIAFDLMVFAHLLTGGLAIGVYGRTQNWPAPASILSAAIFMLGGVVSSRLTHVGIIVVWSLFPLALVTMQRAIRTRSLVAAVCFGAVSALIAVGRNQESLLILFTLAAFFVAEFVTRRNTVRFLLSRALILSFMAISFTVIATIPILLTLQFAEHSNRAEVALAAALKSSLNPVNFANFFVPNIFGSLETALVGEWGPGYGRTPTTDTTDRAFNYLFAGSLTALLIVWHGFLGARLWLPGRRLISGIAIAALVYALGRFTPVFAWLFEYLPGVANFRRPVDASFILVLAMSLLSGALVSDYVRDGAPNVSRTKCVWAILGVFGVLAWAIAFSFVYDKGFAATLEVAKSLPVYAALIAALMAAKSHRMRTLVITACVALSCGELVGRNAASTMNAESRLNYAILENADDAASQIIDVIKTDMRRRNLNGDRPRVEIVGLGGAWQNAAMIYGLEATNGYNPMRIGPYDRLVSPGESPYNSWHRLFPRSFPGYDSRLARLLGLQYIVIDRPLVNMPRLKKRVAAEPLMVGPKAWIYRLKDATARVSFERRVKIAGVEDYADSVGPLLEAVEPDTIDDANERRAPVAAARSGGARIIAWRADRIEIAIETTDPGVLTLHDPWYPGWEVEVDDVRRPLLRTEVLFRGVEIPAGAQKVVFAYRPLSRENLTAAARGLFGGSNQP